MILVGSCGWELCFISLKFLKVKWLEWGETMPQAHTGLVLPQRSWETNDLLPSQGKQGPGLILGLLSTWTLHKVSRRTAMMGFGWLSFTRPFRRLVSAFNISNLRPIVKTRQAKCWAGSRHWALSSSDCPSWPIIFLAILREVRRGCTGAHLHWLTGVSGVHLYQKLYLVNHISSQNLVTSGVFTQQNLANVKDHHRANC